MSIFFSRNIPLFWNTHATGATLLVHNGSSPSILDCIFVPGAPLTCFDDGGDPTEVHILYPKKSQLQNLSTQKNPYFFSIPQKNPSVFLHQQILLFVFWKAKTCQLQLWFWPKTKLQIALMLLFIWADEKYNTQKNPFWPKCQTQKNPSDPPVIKICEWGPWDFRSAYSWNKAKLSASSLWWRLNRDYNNGRTVVRMAKRWPWLLNRGWPL